MFCSVPSTYDANETPAAACWRAGIAPHWLPSGHLDFVLGLAGWGGRGGCRCTVRILSVVLAGAGCAGCRWRRLGVIECAVSIVNMMEADQWRLGDRVWLTDDMMESNCPNSEIRCARGGWESVLMEAEGMGARPA